MARTPRAEYLVLDLETVPDTSRWSRPDTPHGDSAFPPTWAHRIVVIGGLWLDDSYRLRRFGLVDGMLGGADHDSAESPESPDAREKRLLEDLSRFVGNAHTALVTYNGRSFDLPVLVMRSLCHAVALPWYYREPATRARYTEGGHLDLCDWLADHGAVRAGKLDTIARLIGLPGKTGMDGSQVEGLYKAGQLDTIQRYCLTDVAQTALLFLRFRLLQGKLSPAQYHDRAAALLDALAADGRVQPMLDQLDRPRVLGSAATL